MLEPRDSARGSVASLLDRLTRVRSRASVARAKRLPTELQPKGYLLRLVKGRLLRLVKGLLTPARPTDLRCRSIVMDCAVRLVKAT